MSSPINTTAGSRSISSYMACLMASRKVTFGAAAGFMSVFFGGRSHDYRRAFLAAGLREPMAGLEDFFATVLVFVVTAGADFAGALDVTFTGGVAAASIFSATASGTSVSLRLSVSAPASSFWVSPK